MNLTELRDELNGLAGLDLTTAEANRLINEGYRALICRSEWQRANLELGPTVANQAAYTFPATVHRIRKLKVNGVPYRPVGEEQVDSMIQQWASIRVPGVYWVSFDSSSVEHVSLYPTPTQALSITANCSTYPTALSVDTDTPAVDAEYHRAIVDYAAALAYGYQEDNPDLRDYHEGKFSEKVGGLSWLRNSRSRSGPVQIRVAGVTA